MALFRKNKNSAYGQEPGTKTRLSLGQIAATGGSQQIRDVSTALWFPAGQPIRPVAPPGTPPRRMAYQPLTNINFSGRDGGVNFGALRQFSRYSIVRAIIESVLDRLCSEDWDFRIIAQDDETKKDYKKRNATDPRIKALKKFFRKPDGWQNFRTWSRGLYDDMLVLDAASIWLQREGDPLRTGGELGPIASLVQIDGATVFPLVDETGQQPDPTGSRYLAATSNKKADRGYLNKVKGARGKITGNASNGTQSVQGGSPAFQLTPYGFPAQEMTADELVYAVRNRKTFAKFGFSIVEQALAIIALGLARQDFQAAYYTSGNVPEFIAFLPPDCPVSKAEELNGYLDSILTGQLGNRRKGFFLPSYGSEKSPNIVFPKANDEVLKDVFDEWLARVLCFFFGMSPTAFIKQVNRATADNMSQESEEQGLQPYLDWMKDTLDGIVQDQLGFEDIEAVTGTRKEQDEEKQANIEKVYVSVGIKTLNDLREENGDDPYAIPEADMPMIITATGAQPIGMQHQIEQKQAQISAGVIPDPNAPPEPPGGTPGKPGKPGKKPPTGKPAAKKEWEEFGDYGFLSKKKDTDADVTDSRHDWPTISPGILSRKTSAARVRTEIAIQKCFRAARSAAIARASSIRPRSAESELKRVLDGLLRKVRAFDSVQYNLDPRDARSVLGIPVDDKDLAAKGRELEPHVTVLFGLHEQPLADINSITDGVGPIDVVLGDFIAFPEGPDGVPLVIAVASDKLNALHDALSALPNSDSHPKYQGHITVGYLNPGTGTAAKYLEAGNPLFGERMTLSDIVFSGKDKTMVPLAKADDDEEHIKEMADDIYEAIRPYFESLAMELANPYEDSALSGVQIGALQMNVDDAGMLNSINQQASDWARERAAELVGMAMDEEGTLIPNPNAKWAITDTTRQDLRDIVADSFIGNTDWEDFKTNIKAALESSRTFSDARAEMIARTEMGRAQGGSTWQVWKKSGLVTTLLWEATGPDPCVLCLMNDQQEVPFGKAFPSGAYSTLDSHPNCQCQVRAVAFS